MRVDSTSLSRKPLKVFWLAVVLAGFTCSVSLILQSFRGWRESPISTSVEASVLHPHWSRSNEARLSLVQSFIVFLCQQSYAIKNQLVVSKALG